MTVGLGWTLLAHPALADGARTDERIALLRQRMLPASDDHGTVAVCCQRGRSARRHSTRGWLLTIPPASSSSDWRDWRRTTRARGLFIETVEGAVPPAQARPGRSDYQPDPRFALFDRQVAYTTIRMSFETDYAGLGRFLWNLASFPASSKSARSDVQPRAPATGPGRRHAACIDDFSSPTRERPPRTAAVER